MSSKIPFVDLERIHKRLAKPLEEAYRRVLSNSSFIQGAEVAAFEREWSEYCNVPYTIGCANGTDALMLILLALGIGNGDEVVTVSNTFFATVEAICAVGAKPVMVDVHLADGLIDVAAAELAITDSTRAIIAVHLYGHPCELDALKKICEKRKIYLIEDAAQAHGACYNGIHVGGFGVAAAFSFFPGKNLGALGDAGAVVTRDQGLAEKMQSLRNHGRGGKEKYSHHLLGYNMRMDGLQAAFLRAKLPMLDEWNADRKRIAIVYDDAMRDIGVITHFKSAANVRHAHHLYVICHDRRDDLARSLTASGISCGVHYPLGCHQQPGWTAAGEKLSLPNTERISSTCLSLPIFGGMTEDEAIQVVSVLRATAEL